jgi:phage repressor protein C with HTH and peptisase S24 domain
MEIVDIRRARLAQLIRERYESQADFVSKTGYNQGEVSALLKNKSFGEKKARKIETDCGLPAGWLDTSSDTHVAALRESESTIPGAMRIVLVDEHSPNQYRIPMVTLKLQAGVTGFQTEPDRRDGGTIGLSMNWVDRKGYNPAQLMAMQVHGESMEPTFYENDTVVINLADKVPVDNGVFAVNYDGEAVVKRLSRDAGQWWLMSDNPDQRKYYRRTCSGTECIIIGRVVRREGDQF